MDEFYRRKLPHIIPAHRPIFVTWNLEGAIPQHRQEELRLHDLLLREAKPLPGETPEQRKVRIAKLHFVEVDRGLDHAAGGPMHLQGEAAGIVDTDIQEMHPEFLHLEAWCVMANHVHLLMVPRLKFAEVMQRLKGRTARRINLLLGRTGETLWQHESYDHFSRDDDESERIVTYIENNPVKAGLCERPADWPYSSARFRDAWPFHPGPAEAGPTAKPGSAGKVGPASAGPKGAS